MLRVPVAAIAPIFTVPLVAAAMVLPLVSVIASAIRLRSLRL